VVVAGIDLGHRARPPGAEIAVARDRDQARRVGQIVHGAAVEALRLDDEAVGIVQPGRGQVQRRVDAHRAAQRVVIRGRHLAARIGRHHHVAQHQRTSQDRLAQGRRKMLWLRRAGATANCFRFLFEGWGCPPRRFLLPPLRPALPRSTWDAAREFPGARGKKFVRAVSTHDDLTVPTAPIIADSLIRAELTPCKIHRMMFSEGILNRPRSSDQAGIVLQ